MALTNEDLKAITELLKPINDRLDKIDNRLDRVDSRLDVLEYKQDRTTKKLDDLQLDVKLAEREIRRDIHRLKDSSETVTELMRIHQLTPQ